MKQIYKSKHTFGLMGLLYFTLHYYFIAFKNQNVVSDVVFRGFRLKNIRRLFIEYIIFVLLPSYDLIDYLL